MKLPKIKKRFWIPALVLTVLISGAWVYHQHYIVDYFDLTDMIRHEQVASWYFPENEPVLKPIQDVDEQMREKNAGFIAVIKPYGLRKNALIGQMWADSNGFLSPFRQYAEYRNADSVQTSHVLTSARVVEVLYQGDSYDLRAGKTLTIKEDYCILDQRIPNIVKSFTPNPYVLIYPINQNKYSPMENGETYLFFGNIYTDLYNQTIAYSHDHVIICLSNPDKQAGFHCTDHQQRINYIRQTYTDQLRAYVNE